MKKPRKLRKKIERAKKTKKQTRSAQIQAVRSKAARANIA